MKKLRIIYLGHIDNSPHRDSDEDIKYGLEKLGHEVIAFDDRKFKPEDILKVKKPDLFIFHKGGVPSGGMAFNMGMMRLVDLLDKLKCKKVFWYPDKVWGDRERWMELVVPFVDYGFMQDGTWARRHNYDNIITLRQGAPEFDTKKGKFREDLACNVAFAGTIYGPRIDFVLMLNKIYGEKFKVFTPDISNQYKPILKSKGVNIKDAVWQRDLADLCASAKVIVSPRYPQDDFYWSARIYMTLVYGGLLIHPKLYGLEEEDGLINYKHYVGYKSGEELLEQIDFFLENRDVAKRIAEQGREYVLKNLTYSERLKKMLEIIYEKDIS
jgi:hypothetical protein